jgi:hypothetical protein
MLNFKLFGVFGLILTSSTIYAPSMSAFLFLLTKAKRLGEGEQAAQEEASSHGGREQQQVEHGWLSE